MRKRPIILICLTFAIILLAVTGYGAGKKPPTKITIMSTMFAPEPVSTNNPVIKRIEEYTNTQLEFIWVPDKSYNDKFGVMLAGNSLPDVVLIKDIGSTTKINVRNAIKAGAFWDIGPYLKSFHNLRKADPGLLQRSSIEGKIYAIPRERMIARLGLTYRKDWANNLGFTKPPKKLDEFYKLLKAFTFNDPDGNGQNDTFGLSDQSSMSGFNAMSTWFGTGSEFEYKDGKIVPWFMSQAYLDAMTFARKLYAEGLVNKDFISVRSKADNLLAGKAGMIFGAMDDASRNQDLIRQVAPHAELDVFSLVDAGKGIHVRPENSGFKGGYAFAKGSVKDEARLKELLAFFDKLCDKEMNDLIEYGIKGLSYDIVEGKAAFNGEQGEKNGIRKADLDDISQFRTFRYSINPVTPPQMIPLQEKYMKMIQSNLRYVVFNAIDGLYSETYTLKEADLRVVDPGKIFVDAQAKYIMGLIDQDALKAAFDRWVKSGGDKVMEEFTAAYNAMHGKK